MRWLGISLIALSCALLPPACAESEDNLGPVAGSAGAGAFGGSAGVGGSMDASSEAGAGGLGGASGSGGTAGLGGSGGGTLEGAADVPTCEKQTADSTCGTWPQCGCDVGQKCDVIEFGTGKAVCSTEGTALPYQPCFNPGLSCIAGSTCIGNVCKPYCDSLSDCPGQNRQCIGVQWNDGGVLKQVPGMFTCSAGCDPINPGTICAANLACNFTQTNTTTDCYAAGTATGPGTCSQTNGSACAPGHVCVNNNNSYDCLKWCRMNNPNDCSSPQVCIGLSSAPVLNGVQYGVCA